MRQTFYLLPLLLSLLFAAPPMFWGQEVEEKTHVSFKPFRLSNGVPGNHPQAITQAFFGFRWFGSQYGLHRWKGHHCKPFLHDLLAKPVISLKHADPTVNWQEANIIPLIIPHSWWTSWWAYLLYALAFAALIAGAYRFQLRRSLEQAEAARLRELDKVKTRLYNNITHEFRTPLTIISGMAAQIREHPSQWSDEGMRMIQRNSDRLLQLITQMLDLNKLESGKLDLQLRQDDIIPFLKYIVENMRSYAESQEIQVHFHTETEKLLMDFDHERVQQIMTNLLSNAVRFTPQGGHIYINVQTDSKAQTDTLLIKVRDTGEGINEEDIRHIFNRFYQVDDSVTLQSGGTGIGLALTKELVKLMDGEIEVKSRVGTETEFTVMLPIRIEAPQTTVSTDSVNVQHEAARGQTAYQADYAALQRSLSHYQGSSKPLLLVAEVNPDVVAYLASCLSDHYRLTVTKDGREALEMATHTTPDLIISDVMLPYLDGFELTKTLKQDERTSHIPIIMLTAKADMESKLRSLEEGADAYLAKPFNNKELLIRIRKLLELRWQLQQHYLLIAGGRAPAIADYNLEQTEQPENQFIKKARKLVDEHLDDYEFSVEQFCQEIGMSNSQLHRKLTAVTGLSATKFIRHVRLSKAKELLRDPSTSVTAVAYDTGFNDPSYFGRIFKKEFGLTPREWQHHAAEDD